MYKLGVAIVLSLLYLTDAESACKKGMRWAADPEDCSSFWLCLPFMTAKYKCPGETVTNPYMEACVPKDSKMDICSKKKPSDVKPKLDKSTLKMLLQTTTTAATTTTTTPTMSPTERLCKENPTAIISHPDHCAKYIDCSKLWDEEKGEGECPYPLLWDEGSKRCEHHQKTKCGNRYEPVDPCDYTANQCSANSHCVPCEVRFPSCRGLEDGLQPWRGREYSPYFVVCSNQRLARQGQCTYEEKGMVFFHPDKKTCISRY